MVIKIPSMPFAIPNQNTMDLILILFMMMLMMFLRVVTMMTITNSQSKHNKLERDCVNDDVKDYQHPGHSR